ncbi:MAG: hypothetical protein ACOZBH_04800 [Patescibacteria group bacterium]
MFKFYYPIRIKSLIIPVIFWAGWMIAWIWAPSEILVWGPIKYIIIAIFAPIGVIILGALTGYRVEFDQVTLKVGFFPFIRKIKVEKVSAIKKGGIYPRSLWQTSDFVTLGFKDKKGFSFPCNEAEKIIDILKRFIKP